MTDWFAEVSRLVEAEPEPSGAVRPASMLRLCSAATRALSASGAGVSVMISERVRGVVAASDVRTTRLEELQFTTGEGPCIDAFSLRRPVLVPEVSASHVLKRWPIYAPAVHEAGVRAVFAFPLQVGAAQLGILDVFRESPGPLADGELTLALTFADVAVSTLLDAEQTRPLGDGHGLDDVLGSGAELFQAQGMAMVQLGVSISEALLRIRALAYAENRSLSEVAADIVARRITLDRD